MTILYHFGGSPVGGWLNVISSSNVTVSPLCKCPSTSPMNDGCPRTLTELPFTTVAAVAAGLISTLLLILPVGSLRLFPVPWPRSFCRGIRQRTGLALEQTGAELASCARAAVAVNTVSAVKIQKFFFIPK